MNSTFDLLLWNKATKDYYFIKGLRDSSITASNITGTKINNKLYGTGSTSIRKKKRKGQIERH